MACALINNRVAVWEYLPTPWNGEAAADFYRNTLGPALRRLRGRKASYRILEDEWASVATGAPSRARRIPRSWVFMQCF